jgi:integrase
MSAQQDKASKAPRRIHGFGALWPRRHGPKPAGGEPDARPVHWWIRYWYRGKQHPERVQPNTEAAAWRLLRQRNAEVLQGRVLVAAERVTFEDLATLLVNDYIKQGRRSLDTVKRSIVHLRRFFGLDRAVDITRARCDAYIASRLEAEAKPATVQKELAALGRMFNLALEVDMLTARPHIARLKYKNTRTVSFTDEELDLVLDVLMHGRPATAKDPEVKAQPDLVPPILFAGMTAWRMKSDVLTLRWPQVDFGAGTVTRWSRGTSKATDHIVFPFDALPELAALLKRQREATTALERETGNIVLLVFHRRGKPIHSLHAAWRAACRRAGVPGRVPHDLRRTGARAMRALGVDKWDIADLGGWKTVAMVDAYLGKDPTGVAERLRLKTGTIPERFGSGTGSGEK